MGESNQQSQEEKKQTNTGEIKDATGTQIRGDKITLGDIEDSIIAAGEHSQATVNYIQKGEEFGPPSWWQRVRNHPWVFYPTLIISGFLSFVLIVFAAVSAGADLGPATQQFYEWGLIRSYPSARENEALIIIMEFHRPEGIPDTEPHEKIRRAIEQQASDLGLSHVRVEVDPRTLTQDERERAEEITKDTNAIMIIWGEDTGVEFSANFYSSPKLAPIKTEILETGEVGKTLFAQPDEYAQFITQELPSMSTFLSFFAIGHASMESKEYNNAIISFESAITFANRLPKSENLSETLSSTYNGLGVAKLQINEFTSAINHFTQAIQTNPQKAGYFNNRALAEHLLGQFENAIADYDRAEEIDPRDSSVFSNRGSVYQDLGRFEDALADYNRAIELDPLYSAAVFNRGNNYFHWGRYEEAIADYDRAIELDPLYSAAYAARGHTYEVLGQYVTAIADYTRAIELDPEEEIAFLNRGNVYSQLGRHETVIIDDAQASELDYKDLELNWGTYFDLDKYENAIDDYTRHIELNPSDPKGYAGRGNIYHDLEQHENAIADYTKQIELEPLNIAPLDRRGTSYHELGRFEEALTDFNRAIEIDPLQPVLFYHRGRLYYAMGRYEEALADFNQAIELDPPYPMNHLSVSSRGYTYYKLGRYEDAIADFNRFIEADPSNYAAHLQRGAAYYNLGRYEDAFADFNRAIEIDPRQYAAYVQRGIAYENLDSYEDAIENYNHAIELLANDSPLVGELLNRISEIKVLINKD